MRHEFSKDPVKGAPWAFIAVMGVTGAGKSTFIRWASGDEEVEVGHDLHSCQFSPPIMGSNIRLTC
jgi:ABC-type hemin transport system ATPase subunit